MLEALSHCSSRYRSANIQVAKRSLHVSVREAGLTTSDPQAVIGEKQPPIDALCTYPFKLFRSLQSHFLYLNIISYEIRTVIDRSTMFDRILGSRHSSQTLAFYKTFH